MLDKDKLLEFLKREIESCRIVGNESDKAISWECQRIIERINAGLFDIDKDPEIKELKDKNLDLALQLQSTKPLYSRRLLEENIEMAIYETELLHKTLKPSENSNIDRRFKNIVEILKG